MGLKFEEAWENKVDQDKKEIEKIEVDIIDKKLVIDKMG